MLAVSRPKRLTSNSTSAHARLASATFRSSVRGLSAGCCVCAHLIDRQHDPREPDALVWIHGKRRALEAGHGRSGVETKRNCLKLLGQRLTARDFDRQVTEVQIRVAGPNRFTVRGILVTAAVG